MGSCCNDRPIQTGRSIRRPHNPSIKSACCFSQKCNLEKKNRITEKWFYTGPHMYHTICAHDLQRFQVSPMKFSVGFGWLSAHLQPPFKKEKEQGTLFHHFKIIRNILLLLLLLMCMERDRNPKSVAVGYLCGVLWKLHHSHLFMWAEC